jgi:hypothetical protein
VQVHNKGNMKMTWHNWWRLVGEVAYINIFSVTGVDKRERRGGRGGEEGGRG